MWGASPLGKSCNKRRNRGGGKIFTFLLAYWIDCMFLEIFGMGIETILFCFIADEEMFKVNPPYCVLWCVFNPSYCTLMSPLYTIMCIEPTSLILQCVWNPQGEDRFATGELMTTLQKKAQAAASLKIAQEPVQAEAIKVSPLYLYYIL
jgi:hypothetical protein